MSVKVQVILDEEEALRFKRLARREAKSLSAWLRDAGRKMLEEHRRRMSLRDPALLERFFKECDLWQEGREPEWDEHKRLILNGHSSSMS